MASRNVSLKLEAYDALKSEKHEGESFSDAVLRLTRGRPSLSSVLASFEPLDRRTADEYGRQMRRVRAELDKSMRKRLR